MVDYCGAVGRDGRISGSAVARGDDGAAVEWRADEVATRWG